MLHRFSKRCQPFSQNGTERNDKNYGKKTTVPRAFYGTEFGTFFGAYCTIVVHQLTGSFDSSAYSDWLGAGPASTLAKAWPH